MKQPKHMSRDDFNTAMDNLSAIQATNAETLAMLESLQEGLQQKIRSINIFYRRPLHLEIGPEIETNNFRMTALHIGTMTYPAKSQGERLNQLCNKLYPAPEPDSDFRTFLHDFRTSLFVERNTRPALYFRYYKNQRYAINADTETGKYYWHDQFRAMNYHLDEGPRSSWYDKDSKFHSGTKEDVLDYLAEKLSDHARWSRQIVTAEAAVCAIGAIALAFYLSANAKEKPQPEHPAPTTGITAPNIPQL